MTEKFQIKVALSPYDTLIHRNGEPLGAVTRFSVSQSIGHELPELVLWMNPDLIELELEIDPIVLFDRPEGYDPYNSEARPCQS